MAEIEMILLLADDAGRFLGIADKPEPAEGQELIEWPVRKLAPRTPQAGGWEFASDVLSSDSAELGKIGSMDVIVQVAQYVAARDGWECYGVLPGQFGAAIYPPSVTVMFRRRAVTVYPSLTEALDPARRYEDSILHASRHKSPDPNNGIFPVEPIGHDPVGEAE